MAFVVFIFREIIIGTNFIYIAMPIVEFSFNGWVYLLYYIITMKNNVFNILWSVLEY